MIEEEEEDDDHVLFNERLLRNSAAAAEELEMSRGAVTWQLIRSCALLQLKDLYLAAMCWPWPWPARDPPLR
jgi:hypothetical protein